MLRPVFVLLEEAVQVDALARRPLAKAHDVLLEENAHLVGIREVLEDRLHRAVSLAHAQHREAMESATQIEEEARFHWDTTFGERQRAHKELKAVTRQAKADAAQEATARACDEPSRRLTGNVRCCEPALLSWSARVCH